MPYGSFTPELDHPSITMTSVWNGGTPVTLTTWSMNTFSGTKWFRSGTNANKGGGTMCTRFPGPMKMIVINLPLGPRLPYKVYSKKAKRMVWARQPVKVYKLKRMPSKVKYVKGNSPPPNNLNYSSVSMKATGSNGLYAQHTSMPNTFKTYSGDLYDGFTPIGSMAALPLKPDISDLSISNYQGDLASLEKQAIQKLYSKVKNQSVNLAQAMVERAQTIQLLSDLVQRALRAIIAVKRGQLALATRLLLPSADHESIAKDWLALQYGLIPLISDIDGTIKHIKEWEDHIFVIKVRASEKVSQVTNPIGVGHHIRVVMNTHRQSEGTVIYRVKCKIGSPFGRNLTRLGFTNLNALAWEVIPFSFIIDWLIPIGENLNSRDAFEGLEVLECHKTVFLRENMSYERRFGGLDDQGYQWSEGMSSFATVKVSCNRQRLSAPPVLPSFPSVKNPFSRTHFYNLVALATVLFPKSD